MAAEMGHLLHMPNTRNRSCPTTDSGAPLTDSKPPERRRKIRRKSDNFLYTPARRVYVISIAVVLIIAFVAAWFGTQAYFKGVDRDICRQDNVVRREMNARTPEHQKDANDLIKFLKLSGTTRGSEAKAWISIQKLFNEDPNKNTPAFKTLNSDISLLIVSFKYDHKIDQQILAAQRKLRFNNLPIIDCKKVY